MSYRVTAAVAVRIEKMQANEPACLVAAIEQSATRTTGSPALSYCYPEANDAIDEARETVLRMMEAAYGISVRQR